MTNFKPILSLIPLLALSIGFWPTASRAQINTDTFQNFRDWCQHRDQLPREDWHTVEAILDAVETEDCLEVEEQLKANSFLALGDRRIESLNIDSLTLSMAQQ